MLLSRHAVPAPDSLTNASTPPVSTAQGDDAETPPHAPPPRLWTRLAQRLACVFAPRYAAHRGLLQLDEASAFADCPRGIEGCPEHRETLSLRGRRVLLGSWGAPPRPP